MRPSWITIDVEAGETYWLTLPDRTFLATFEKVTLQHQLRFSDEQLDMPVDIAPHLFEKMRSDGRAVRIPKGSIPSRKKSAFELGDVHPATLLDPEERGIGDKERKERLAQWQKFERARTLAWCASEYDATPHLGRGHNCIDDHFKSKDVKKRARELGFVWRPDAATILRAIDACGVPGSRPVSAFFDKRGKHDRSKRYPDVLLTWAKESIDAYWASITERYCDVRESFYKKIDEENEERVKQGLEKLPRISPETFRKWVDEEESWWTWSTRYGEKAANARYKGRGVPMEASRPLELVLIDHTRLDVWAVVEDQYGRLVMTERPWLTLAIDVYSRMILGAVLSFEPPSVYSAMLCLRQIVRAKDFLIEKYGHHKGATDGWGKPTTIVMDNAWEFSGISMQSVCEAAGIHVVWAPVGTPTFKAIVERFFRTLNEMVWHRLGSGIPFKPQVMQELGLDPRAKALFRIDYLTARMWDGIVNIYHVEPHSDLNMAPAERWSMGVQAKTRPTIDDVGALDKMLGNVSRCILSAEGVSVNGQRFHEPATTTALLENLLKYGAKRSRRKGFGSSGTVAVIANWDRVDASHVHVWDFSNNTSVRLPNVDKHVHGIPGVDGAPAQGLSWAVVDAIKAFAAERNMAFHSPQEKAAARHAYYHEMPEKVAAMPFNAARHYAAEIDRSPSLVDGDTVIQHAVPATPKGAAAETPREFSAAHRTGEWAPPKAPSRGRKSRSSGSKGRPAPPSASPPKPPETHPAPADLSNHILNSAAALDALADDL
ncbi:MAG: hypothetical protein CMF04_15700 [Hyphomonas sp.]|jgi:putative transposase|nr:hypothetical protein [Hyphomonas sp.]